MTPAFVVGGAGHDRIIVKNNPVNLTDPNGLEIRVYSSDAFGISGLNHAFLYSTETGRGKGTNGSSWYTLGNGVGDLNSPYVVIPLPFGMSEDAFMNRVEAAKGWNNWLWIPWVNDCHSDVKSACKQSGVTCPDAPNERIDFDDDLLQFLSPVWWKHLLFGGHK